MDEMEIISIHAPRTGSDSTVAGCCLCRWKYFNPRSPHGERLRFRKLRHLSCHFNPRSPHGERHAVSASKTSILVFQSTLPARGATVRFAICLKILLFQSTLPARGATQEAIGKDFKVDGISIHAPRTGSDQIKEMTTIHLIFQSTLPARGATQPYCVAALVAAISIHAPRTGSDCLILSYL